jgi:small subunit ribosomal protein S17
MAEENENVNETDETPETSEEAVEAAAEETTEAPEAEAPEAPAAEAEVADAPEAEAAEPEPAAEEAEAPAAEAEAPAAEAPAAEAEAPAEPVQKKKRKRVPRSLRPARTRRRHVPSAERKAITRLPKPEHERGRRQERQGTVVSANSDKTIVVRVDTVKAHRMYKKVIRRSTKLHAHDETNQAKVGDIVRIVETRPLSRMKRWRLQEVVQEAK